MVSIEYLMSCRVLSPDGTILHAVIWCCGDTAPYGKNCHLPVTVLREHQNNIKFPYSTVTDFARFLGISTSFPRRTDISRASSCVTTIISKNSSIGCVSYFV